MNFCKTKFPVLFASVCLGCLWSTWLFAGWNFGKKSVGDNEDPPFKAFKRLEEISDINGIPFLDVPLKPQPPSIPIEFASAFVKKGNQNIFYIETSCVYNKTKEPPGGSVGGVALNYRHACCVYSTAARHPNRPVYVYHTCPLDEDYYEKSSEAVKRLLELKNLFIVQIGSNPQKWFKKTPLEGFENKLNGSNSVIVQASDALRILLLWKYGGQYLDLDVMSLRDLSGLGVNWIGAEKKYFLNNAVLNFESSGPGHKIVETLLNEIPNFFNPRGWFSIGPSLTSTLIGKMCKTTRKESTFEQIIKKNCSITIYPKEVIFPVHPKVTNKFYKNVSGGWELIKDLIRKGYTIHVWNTTFGKNKIEDGSPFQMIAKKFCPLIYDACYPNF